MEKVVWYKCSDNVCDGKVDGYVFLYYFLFYYILFGDFGLVFGRMDFGFLGFICIIVFFLLFVEVFLGIFD